jgi:hypothetical protein
VQHHLFAGVLIASAWPLPEAPRAPAGHPAIRIESPTGPPPDPTSIQVVHDWESDARTMPLTLARYPNGYLLRFPDLADFGVSIDGDRVHPWPRPDTNDETLRHLLLDQVLPRLLTHRGGLALHAGGVCLEGRHAIAFVGETGRGKSTLSASFELAGHPLLSDDGLVLTTNGDQVSALPTYPSLRLWPDALDHVFPETPALSSMAHYSSKLRVVRRAGGAGSEPTRLVAIYVLDSEAAAVTIEPLSIRDAAMTIIANTFQLDVTDRRRAAAVFGTASDVAERVQVYRLQYPRDYGRLPEVHHALKDHLGR